MTPLLLVTGFLGAGKTTFLRALLPACRARGLRARVVLNDFEDARIDGATLADVAPDLVALAGSCVCCESLEDLMAALGALAGEPNEIVIVEANGGTESSDLVALLGSDLSLDRLSPPLQLTVVDAKRFGTRGWQNEIEREQLSTATHLTIGRADQVDPVRRLEVEAGARALAQHAQVVSAEGLAGTLLAVERWVRAIPSRTRLNSAGGEEAGVAWAVPLPRAGEPHDHLHPHFASLMLELPHLIDEEDLAGLLRGLPREVLRAKGVAALAPDGRKRTFQKVEDEVEISPCELADPDDVPARAIFVGPHLPVDQITAAVRDLGRRS